MLSISVWAEKFSVNPLNDGATQFKHWSSFYLCDHICRLAILIGFTPDVLIAVYQWCSLRLCRLYTQRFTCVISTGNNEHYSRQPIERINKICCSSKQGDAPLLKAAIHVLAKQLAQLLCSLGNLSTITFWFCGNHSQRWNSKIRQKRILRIYIYSYLFKSFVTLLSHQCVW